MPKVRKDQLTPDKRNKRLQIALPASTRVLLKDIHDLVPDATQTEVFKAALVLLKTALTDKKAGCDVGSSTAPLDTTYRLILATVLL